MNPIIVPVRNNLHLTRKAVDSFRKQDVSGGVDIIIINNGSTDGTTAWCSAQRDIMHLYYDPPLSVAASWNTGLKWAFKMGAEAALVVNNDVELLPQTYRLLAEDGGDFVTAVGTRSWPVNIGTPDPANKRPHPDFSCFLIDMYLYENIGPFDERFEIAYCEDGDYDMRMWKDGIRAYCIDLPFLHHGAATVKWADPAEARQIQMQADKNREYFKKKWGFAMGSIEYYRALGKDDNPDATLLNKTCGSPTEP